MAPPWLKIVCSVSAAFGLVLLTGSSWIFVSHAADLDNKLKYYGLLDLKTHDEIQYGKLLQSVKTLWAKNKPILMTCSAISILAALIQLTVSLLIICSPKKDIQQRAKIWMISHFMLFITLAVCSLLLLTSLFTEINFDNELNSWWEILDRLRNFVAKAALEMDISKLITFFKTGAPILFGLFCMDLLAVILLFFSGIYAMHKYNGYESHA